MALVCLAGVPTPAVIGMIHVPALPGTPRHRQPLAAACDQVRAEARLYAEAGADAIMLENMHDVPYLLGAVGPEITAAMTAAALAARDEVACPVGVQILAAANAEALAVALAARLAFVRVEGFVFGHLADEGWLDACSGPLLRQRRRLGADGVAILADVKKKHASHAVTADLSLAETVRAAAFAGADAVVVTGAATGQATDPAALAEARQADRVPVVVGSGVTRDNLSAYLAADAVIVGSHVKTDGHWAGSVDRARLVAFMDRARELRGAG
jgi:membrane complex biogenesis BtpA family protein